MLYYLAVDIDQYALQIKQRIKRYWIKPANLPDGLSVKLRVKMIPGGDVASVRVTDSSGNKLFDSSVENAVYRAAPFPMPSSAEAAGVVLDQGMEIYFSEN